MKSHEHISSSGQRPPSRSAAWRQPRRYSWRTARRFGWIDKATQTRAIRQYRASLEGWLATPVTKVPDDGNLILPNQIYLDLVRSLEVYDLPVARYDAWRMRDPADACLRLVALTKFGMSAERAEQIEEALFALRPADEISAVGSHEIRKVLKAHRVYGEFQRDEIERERPSITSLAS